MRQRTRRAIVSRWCVLLAALVALPAAASTPRVVLGDVSVGSTVKRARLQTFRELAEQELAQLAKTNGRQRYVISLSLLELETVTSGQRARSSCVVSALLQDQRGTLVAMTKGRASAQDASSEVRQNELDVMQAALRSALRRVPEAVK